MTSTPATTPTARTAPTAPTAPTADFPRAAVQLKPWGYETIFADGGHGYAAKVITVHQGHSLSLQLHGRKDETLHVLAGTARLEHGSDADILQVVALGPGDTVHLPPRVLHRVTAVTDLAFAEASTAAPGWREDITRLADSYGRTGTTEA